MRSGIFPALQATALGLLVLYTSPSISTGQHTAPIAPASHYAQAIQKLRSLGFWTGTSDSSRDPANAQALIAFRKLNGLKRTGVMREEEYHAIVRAQPVTAHDSLHRAHYEIDLNRQVLLMVDSTDHVYKILCVSTGSGKFFESEGRGRYAMTPRGRFAVYYKITGWRVSPLGKLYYPLYVRGGVAIHGAPQVPATPASHGCIRIPMFAAERLFRMTPIGRVVVIYGENPRPRKT